MSVEEKLDRVIELLECLVANEEQDAVFAQYEPIVDDHVLPECNCDTGFGWCALHQSFYA